MKLTSAIAVYVLANLMLISPAMAFQVSGEVYTLTPSEAQACSLGGGCVLVPVMQLRAELARVRDESWEEGSKSGARSGYDAGYAAAIHLLAKGST